MSDLLVWKRHNSIMVGIIIGWSQMVKIDLAVFDQFLSRLSKEFHEATYDEIFSAFHMLLGQRSSKFNPESDVQLQS